MHEVLKQVVLFIRQYAVPKPDQSLLVGFSGGVDSTALLLALHSLNLSPTAVHFNHGLRGEAADADAQWCEQFCRARSIPIISECLHVPGCRQPGEGIEEAARRCRLEAWQRLCDDDTVVALGHHADDALEEMLLRLGRGSNVSGLIGLRPVRTVCGIRLVRPLLNVRRSELEVFLRGEGVEFWCEDMSNQDTGLRRNAVRHDWLPVMRNTLDGDGGLFQSLSVLRQDADCLETMAASSLHLVENPAELATVHPALLPRIMRYWLRQQTGRDIVLRHDAVTRLQRSLQVPRVKGPLQIPLGDDITLVLDVNGLRVRACSCSLTTRQWAWRDEPSLVLLETGAEIRSDIVPVESVDLVKKDACVSYVAIDKLPGTITVRARQPGDRLVPFGQQKTKKLKDLLIDARVPQECRDEVPVLEAGGVIFWVPGVRRGEFGRIEDGSKGLVVKFTYSRLVV